MRGREGSFAGRLSRGIDNCGRSFQRRKLRPGQLWNWLAGLGYALGSAAAGRQRRYPVSEGGILADFADAENFGSADRASAPGRGAAVFQIDLFRVGDFLLAAALEAVCFHPPLLRCKMLRIGGLGKPRVGGRAGPAAGSGYGSARGGHYARKGNGNRANGKFLSHYVIYKTISFVK